MQSLIAINETYDRHEELINIENLCKEGYQVLCLTWDSDYTERKFRYVTSVKRDGYSSYPFTAIDPKTLRENSYENAKFISSKHYKEEDRKLRLDKWKGIDFSYISAVSKLIIFLLCFVSFINLGSETGNTLSTITFGYIAVDLLTRTVKKLDE